MKIEKTELIIVEAGNIAPNPKSLREQPSEQTINGILGMWEDTGGILAPILVATNRKGKKSYYCIDGEQRWLAALKKGKTTPVPCICLPDDLTETELRDRTIIANLLTTKMHPYELGNATKEYRQNHPEIRTNGEIIPMSQNALANKLGYPGKTSIISNWEAATRTLTAVRNLLKDANIETQKVWRSLGRLDNDLQLKAAIRFIDDKETLTGEVFESLVRVIKMDESSDALVEEILTPGSKVTREVADKIMEAPKEQQPELLEKARILLAKYSSAEVIARLDDSLSPQESFEDVEEQTLVTINKFCDRAILVCDYETHSQYLSAEGLNHFVDRLEETYNYIEKQLRKAGRIQRLIEV